MKFEWRAMESAPKDGTEIIGRMDHMNAWCKSAWDGRAWVSDGIPIGIPLTGWMPFDEPATVGGSHV